LPARTEKFVQLAGAMGEPAEGRPVREAARLALDAVTHLLRSADLPASLPEIGITDLSKISRWAVKAHAERRLLSRCVRNLTVRAKKYTCVPSSPADRLQKKP
jgi:alcohol dehydrogenase class IV